MNFNSVHVRSKVSHKTKTLFKGWNESDIQHCPRRTGTEPHRVGAAN